jgi:polysaccharide export outer membrane protein
MLLGLAQGCASSKGGGQAEEAEGGPQMRPPAPEAPVYMPGQDEKAETDAAIEQDDEGVAGSRAEETTVYRFKVSDAVMINISGITPTQIIEDIVDEKGFISMPYIGQVKAEGKTASELEEVIFSAYVPDYYKYATVSVFVPASGYFIRGEVRSPGRFPLVSGMTILQAIATAGGYTDYAAPNRVRILRDGETLKINLKDLDKNPELDMPLEARDVIIVPRAWL